MRRRGDPARSENSSDIEQENVPEPHLAAKLGKDFSLGLAQALRLRLAANKIPAANDRDSKTNRHFLKAQTIDE